MTFNKTLVVDGKYSTTPIITATAMDHSNGKEVIYDKETDSFFTLLPLSSSDTDAWEITCKGPIKMPIDIKVVLVKVFLFPPKF